ncbi:hypothetical protein ACE2AJ_01840 [Aquihabitans daechungensis]|uniref:hypothetical protein n=1 Tax=Aquihabitans daechungensis TaxID=1052257 RepID=UPI003BA2E999
MSRRTKTAAIGMVVGLALAVAACGGSEAADKLTEEAIEQSGGGDVDIDSEDGTVKYTDEDGNETEMNIDGEGASLPDGWPSELAPPDSVKLITSNTTNDSTAGGDQVMTILGEASGTSDEFQAAIKEQVTDAGFDVAQDTASDVTGGGYAGLTAKKGEDTLVVAIASDPTREGTVTITMTLTSKA